jgi:hypothetical protein
MVKKNLMMSLAKISARRKKRKKQEKKRKSRSFDFIVS